MQICKYANMQKKKKTGATDRDGNWSDKGNFAALVEELAAAFAGPGWQLSAAVSPAIFRINDGYDVRRISAALDFINVMTYDLHGTWDNYADHHAPLTRRPFDMWATENLHADGGISYWIQKGPFHSLYSFTLIIIIIIFEFLFIHSIKLKEKSSIHIFIF